MRLLLLEEDEPGWAHWCVITKDVGRLSLEAPGAIAPTDPRGKVLEISRTIVRALEGSHEGYQRPWRPSPGTELALRTIADPTRPGAPSQILATHPSALSRADIMIWPEGRESIVVAQEDLKALVRPRPCRALLRRTGEGDVVMALDAPTSIIMLPALDAISMLRLAAKASRGHAGM